MVEADTCGFSRNCYLRLRMDGERTFDETMGQRAKCYPARRADHY